MHFYKFRTKTWYCVLKIKLWGSDQFHDLPILSIRSASGGQISRRTCHTVDQISLWRSDQPNNLPHCRSDQLLGVRSASRSAMLSIRSTSLIKKSDQIHPHDLISSGDPIQDTINNKKNDSSWADQIHWPHRIYCNDHKIWSYPLPRSDQQRRSDPVYDLCACIRTGPL